MSAAAAVSPAPVRVLVVDDSATMRGMITAILRRDPGIEVVGSAADPLAAREAIKQLNPDVITLDIEMPNMDGLSFLERIMRLRPMPVVMLSTLTQAGAEATLRALELGAVDCLAKPTSLDGAAAALSDLSSRVRAAAGARVRPAGDHAPAARPTGAYRPSGHVVAIGSSTGGVEALLNVIGQFPANCPPTVITQHMPATFTASFAARLDRATEASVAEACGARAVGAILTGMGRDGAQGLLAMREAGARTVGQDEATSVVYGMPRAAHEIGAVERQSPIGAIGAAVLDFAGQRI